MGSFSVSEKLLIEEISNAAQKIKTLTRGLSIGAMIKLIRTQLGMSQKILAKRARVPQSTISRIEKGQIEPSLSTIQKVLQAISCDYIISPILKEPVDTMRKKQARKIADKLKLPNFTGTMSWLYGFKTRNNICYRKLTRVGQKLKADSKERLANFQSQFALLNNMDQYDADAIANLDESGIFFDCPSNYTLAVK